MIVSINGICYATYCCVQASLALLFNISFQRNPGRIDLPTWLRLRNCFFHIRLAYSSCKLEYRFSPAEGKIMDRDYRTIAKYYDFAVDRIKGDDLSKFNIERARFRSSWYFLASTTMSVAGYGWALAYKVVCTLIYRSQDDGTNMQAIKNIAVPLILQFFIGASITCLFNMCGTLLTDLNPRNPALTQASSNIVRCALSAAGLAALQEMINHMGPGWTFTIFAGLCLLTAPMILAEVSWGFAWRSTGQRDVELQRNERATI